MNQDEKGRAFRALHRRGDPFLLWNVWDGGSALLAAAHGARALATTSAGHAFTLGRPDGGNVSRDEALAHAADIVRATELPVSADLEHGYGAAPEAVASTVRFASVAGLVGCTIEDTDLPGKGAYEFDHAVRRIEAGVAAARSLDHDFVLTARADGLLAGGYDMDEAMRRAWAFEAAGADCIYVPLPPDLDAIRRVCSEISAPVNVLAAGAAMKAGLSALSEAGAARISLGSLLSRVAQKAMIEASEGLAAGDLSALSSAAAGREVDALLEKGRGL